MVQMHPMVARRGPGNAQTRVRRNDDASRIGDVETRHGASVRLDPLPHRHLLPPLEPARVNGRPTLQRRERPSVVGVPRRERRWAHPRHARGQQRDGGHRQECPPGAVVRAVWRRMHSQRCIALACPVPCHQPLEVFDLGIGWAGPVPQVVIRHGRLRVRAARATASSRDTG